MSNSTTPGDSTPPARRRPVRPLMTGVAMVVALVPIVIALVVAGGGGSAAVAGNAGSATSRFVPAAASGSTATQPAGPTTSAPTSTPVASPAAIKLPPGRGALVASVRRATPLRATPDGRAYARLSPKTEFGSPEVVWVARRSGRWLGVVSPEAGNNHVGWIAASAVSLSRVTWRLHVSLSARKLTVLDDGQVRQRYTVAIGAPDAPTPTGRFAVTDRLLTGDPEGPYGCCILALSAKAPHAIQGWSGGNRIAIHSTPETTSIGAAVSHGCVRLTAAEGRWLIDHIPLGTPTLITA